VQKSKCARTIEAADASMTSMKRPATFSGFMRGGGPVCEVKQISI